MTPEITLTLSILALAVLLFITERLRVDLIALLVLGSLALTGLVTPTEAVSGFSNPAVVTVWAVFILSGGLSRTGVANVVGRQLLRLAGRGDMRLLALIMLTAAIMSAFMNNVGVAALLLPVVMDIARNTRRSPSKLLMPLAFGSLLGGLTTLIGTPPNILASDALREFNLPPFTMFDFAYVGVPVALGGILFMLLIGRRLLPERNLARELGSPGENNLEDLYALEEQLFVIQIPKDSLLSGKTLAESRIGSALGLNVIGIRRGDITKRSPGPYDVIQSEDELLVTGHLDRMGALGKSQQLTIIDENVALQDLTSRGIELAEITLDATSPLLGQSLEQIDFRRKYGVNVLAICRDQKALRAHLQDILLQAEDTLLVQAPHDKLILLQDLPNAQVSRVESPESYQLSDRLALIGIPSGSSLAGRTLAESRLGDAFDLTVLGFTRAGTTHLVPGIDTLLEADDQLLVQGNLESVLTIRGLQDLKVELDSTPDLTKLETEKVGLIEAVLSPHTTLVGKTLRQLHFREKYGLSVLAIWRGGNAYQANLRDMALRFGDALLLYGPREKLAVLAREPDFLVLAEEIQEAPRLRKAPLAVLIMAGVVLSAIMGWLPISIAAVVGGALLILLGCLDMEEAYRFIEWRAVFLIAGMLPLGIAMEKSGAARFLAEGVVSVVGDQGPIALITGLFLLTTFASQVMPNPVVAVLMAPIAINTASDLGLSARALMMVVALAASSSFLSPVGHPANVLIMGPGGYRFTDYIKVGLPLTIVVLLITLLVLPYYWPLF